MIWGFNTRATQRRLADRGRYCGQIDGIFGPLSMTALLSAVSLRGGGHEKALGAAMVTELPKAGITSRLQLAHFLTQGAIETLGFAVQEEDLNYKAARIKQVWPSRFATTAAAQPYAYRPEALANKVYGGRLGNGPEASGDGWRYRGRGLFQLTGKGNYREREEETGLPLVARPEIAAEPATSVRIACLYWAKHGIGRLADADDLTAVRRRVNGGTHGIADARTYLARAKGVLV